MASRCGIPGGLVLVCVLILGMPQSGSAAISDMMYNTADFFSDIGDAMRGADRARDLYYQHRSGPDAARYEREWRDYEHKLEEARIRRMAVEAKISHDELRRMREDGHDWKYISDRYRIDSRKMGYGHKGPHGYDRDHDKDLHRHLHKKDHPGKAKGHYKGAKDGPPGWYKKDDHPGKAKGHYKGTPDGPPGQNKKK